MRIDQALTDMGNQVADKSLHVIVLEVQGEGRSKSPKEASQLASRRRGCPIATVIILDAPSLSSPYVPTKAETCMASSVNPLEMRKVLFMYLWAQLPTFLLVHTRYHNSIIEL